MGKGVLRALHIGDPLPPTSRVPLAGAAPLPCRPVWGAGSGLSLPAITREVLIF